MSDNTTESNEMSAVFDEAGREISKEQAAPVISADEEKNGTDTFGSGSENEAVIPVIAEHKKTSAWKKWLYDKRYYILSFFVPAVLLFAAYAVFGVYPFGDQSVLVLDLNGQYVYYFENLRDIVHGDGSPFISWSRNLSGEIMGIYAYYLASPFTLIVMLLPRSIMTESLLIMQLCKVGTASVTFSYYLRKSRGIRPQSALMFSVLYALMAYMIVQLMNPMWLDGLIYLPLIIRGIERLIDEKRVVGFMIPMALMMIAHFYIAWMLVFFSILYFLYYYFFGKQDPKFRIKEFFGRGVYFAAGGVTAAACASWILIPLYYSLSLGKFDFTDPNFEWHTQFDFIDVFRNFLPNMYDTCRPEGSPSLYCGVITIILVILYFINRRIGMRKKVGTALLMLSIFLSMYISNIDIAWHGMQVPNWLPYRYSFVLCFVIIAAAAESFENLRGITVKDIGLTAAALIIYIFWIDKQGLENANVIYAIWYSAALTAVYALILRAARKKKRFTVGIAVSLSVFTCAEMFLSTLYNLTAIDKDVTYSKHSSYNDYITLGRKTTKELHQRDNGLYRIESDYHRTVNDAMAFGSFGISHSSSTLNAKPIQFLRKLGFSYGGHYIKYKGATYVTDAILGIKYIIEKGGVDDKEIPSSKMYDDLVLTNRNEKDIMNVYENPYALPIAFMVNSAAADCELSTVDYPFENQNKILSSMLSDSKRTYFRRMDIDKIVPENVNSSVYGSHARYTTVTVGQNSQVEFFVTPVNNNMIYLYMPSNYERKLNLWLNKEFLDFYYEGGNMTIQTIGRFNPGEQFSLICTIASDKNEVLFKDEQFFYLNEDMFREAVDILKKHPLEIEEFSEDHLKGTITAEEDGIMFTSITNEPGWTVYVDGEKTETVELYEALIGVPMTEGTHTVEMVFFPKGLKLGILLSVLGVVSTVIAGMYEFAGKKRSKAAA